MSYVGNPNKSYTFADSPVLTGTPTAPTAAAGTNTTQLATTAFVQANMVGGFKNKIINGNMEIAQRGTSN